MARRLYALHRWLSALALVQLGVLQSLVLGAVLGCASAPPAEPPPILPAEDLAVELAPIGHWHVLTPKRVSVSVTDARGGGVAGLEVLVQMVGEHRESAQGVPGEHHARDDGGGRYSAELVPAEIGAHAVFVRVRKGGREVTSTPVACDVVRDGEEGIRVDAAGTAFVYQIRYAWLPGEIHASAGSKVKLVFEVMRGIPRGADIDWSKPWQNRFDHVDAAGQPTVVVESEGVREQIAATYRGLGIYQAERAFPAAEVGPNGREYRVRFTFVDPAQGATVTHAQPYHLRALP